MCVDKPVRVFSVVHVPVDGRGPAESLSVVTRGDYARALELAREQLKDEDHPREVKEFRYFFVVDIDDV